MIDMIVDGQFGSTGKGKLAAFLHSTEKYDYGVCDFGPNAGHTAVLGGCEYVFKMLPVAALFGIPCVVGSGAIVTPDRLIEEARRHGAEGLVYVHPMAAVVTERDVEAERAEGGVKTIASTMQGTGACLARKVMRTHATVARDVPALMPFVRRYGELPPRWYAGRTKVLAETAQGWGLSLDGPFFPHCTGRNVNPMASLDRMNLHYESMRRVWLSARCHPIRVGHYRENDVLVGESGSVYTDQYEMAWGDFPWVKAPEVTTVTKRVRRIFSWSDTMFRESLRAIRPTHLFLNFVNYLTPKVITSDYVPEVVTEFVREKLLIWQEEFDGFWPQGVVLGTGPRNEDAVVVNVPELMED